MMIARKVTTTYHDSDNYLCETYFFLVFNSLHGLVIYVCGMKIDFKRLLAFMVICTIWLLFWIVLYGSHCIMTIHEGLQDLVFDTCNQCWLVLLNLKPRHYFFWQYGLNSSCGKTSAKSI